MKIVIAPDSFKESLTALEVAQAIQQGFARVFLKRSISLCRWQTAAKARYSR